MGPPGGGGRWDSGEGGGAKQMALSNKVLVGAFRASSNVSALTLDANGNYSSGGIPQGVCVVTDASDGNAASVKIATTGDLIVGVADTAPAAGTGDSVAVVMLGIARIKAGGAVSYGDLVRVGSSAGTVTTVPADGATSTYIVGRALEAAAESGDFISVQLAIGSQQIAS